MSAMTIGLSHYLVLAALLFVTAVVGIFLNRKNIITLLMCIELMLLAVNTNFVAFSSKTGEGIKDLLANLVATIGRT